MGEKTIKNMKARKKRQRVRAKILLPSTLFAMVALGSYSESSYDIDYFL